MRKVIFSIFLSIFLFSFISAYSVSLTPSSITKTITEGDTVTQTISYTITNTDNSSTSPITILTSNIPFCSSSKSVIDPIAGNSTVTGTFTLTFSPETGDSGDYNENIYVGSQILSTDLTVEEDNSGECRLIELPHTSSFLLEQGETGSSPTIKVRASSECPDLIFNQIAPQTQMDKPLYIKSEGESEEGKEYSFSIGFISEDVQKGTYNNIYTVSAYSGDDEYGGS